MTLLPDQVAIITGSASGIGRATAIRFVEEGASVVLVDRNREGLKETARLIGNPDRTALVAGDVVNLSTAEKAISTAAKRFSRVDILVNNAAVNAFHPFPETGYREWFAIFNVILKGALQFSRETSRYMIDRKIPGRIVNVSSIHSTHPEPGHSDYDVAKAGLDQLTRCLAVELAPHGIRANAVAPGFVNTPMSVYEGVNELEDPHFLREYVRGRRIPLARPAQPGEIASVILFFASDLSRYVTGQVLLADGGLLLRF